MLTLTVKFVDGSEATYSVANLLFDGGWAHLNVATAEVNTIHIPMSRVITITEFNS